MNTTLMIEIAQFVGVLAALIVIHEFGHFVASRLFKVDVEEFGLGFPPRILTLFEAGGTKFTLNWIPLGGFVRPKGENDPEVQGGLAAASPWVRLVVLVSGPLANILIGVLLYTLIFSRIGMPITNQVLIMGVAPDSPALQAGLQTGDMILRVNDQPIDSMTAIQQEIQSNLGKSTVITFQRNGQTEQVTLVPRSNPPEGQGAIGIEMGNPTKPISLLAALPIGAVTTYEHIKLLLTFPIQILQKQVPAQSGRLVGFKGMFDIYQEVRQTPTTSNIPPGVNLMGYFATITISLGILNLLPIPALDGGRILFVLPEIILRRRIPPAYENAINLVSFALLLILLLYINLQDFINPIQLPH